MVFRISTKIMVRDYCATKCIRFSTCHELFLTFVPFFFVIQNIYVNLNPVLVLQILFFLCYLVYFLLIEQFFLCLFLFYFIYCNFFQRIPVLKETLTNTYAQVSNRCLKNSDKQSIRNSFIDFIIKKSFIYDFIQSDLQSII